MKNFVVLDGVNSSLTWLWILLGVVLGIIIIVIIIFLLNKYVISKKRIQKIINELDRRYEYLHGLLTGQDSQYIQRLDIIGRTNLLYIDIHATYSKKYKEVKDTADYGFQEILVELKSLCDENKNKEFFAKYKEKAPLIKKYDNAINSLNEELIAVIKPEEEAREAALVLKEKLRQVKSMFNGIESELFYVSDSFKKVFDEIESRFKKYENFIETAEYDEAKALLPDIENVLNYLEKIVGTLPQLINSATQEIPSRIENIKDKYNELTLKGYPLQNIEFNEKIKDIETRLDVCCVNIKKLNVNSVVTKIQEIDNDISRIEDEFDNEVASKEEFDQKFGSASSDFSSLETAFIKLSNSLIKIKQIYLVDETHLHNFNILKSNMDEVSKDKRRLEIYIHSKEKTPYSKLKDKVNDLSNGSKKLKEEYDSFIEYIESLKSDSENIYKDINVIFFKLKEYEGKEVSIMNSSIVLNLNPLFDDCYDCIDKIYALTKVVPIDVNKMKEHYETLLTKSNTIFNAIDEVLSYKQKTTNNVILMNRDRAKFQDINTLLTKVEVAYFNGKYKDAYLMSEDVLSKLKDKAGNVQ